MSSGSPSDPRLAVLRDPVVPEEDRFCDICGVPVGRSHDGRPGPLEGFCPNCATPFSFVPDLSPGDLAGRYEVVGPLAYDGQGWRYLALDHTVGERWLVLEQVTRPDDSLAMSAGGAGRAVLAVEHPNIARAYNFVEHPNLRIGYLVSEYVPGRSLGEYAGKPLSLDEIVVFGLEILDAVGYLHRHGLLYSDLKPDNVVVQDDGRLKLTDLLSIRRIGDDETPLMFTSGYSAPELFSLGPSVASDLYGVGRTLQALGPTFGEPESYRRFIDRATHSDPGRRFGSAEEMAGELAEVGREIAAPTTGSPRWTARPAGEDRTSGTANSQQSPPDPPPRPMSRRRTPWRSFVAGLAMSLSPVPRPRPRTRRTGWDGVEARLSKVYLGLGAPENTTRSSGKDEPR